MSLRLNGYNKFCTTQWNDGFDSSALTLPIKQLIEIDTYLVRVTTSPPLFLFCAEILIK